MRVLCFLCFFVCVFFSRVGWLVLVSRERWWSVSNAAARAPGSLPGSLSVCLSACPCLVLFLQRGWAWFYCVVVVVVVVVWARSRRRIASIVSWLMTRNGRGRLIDNRAYQSRRMVKSSSRRSRREPPTTRSRPTARMCSAP